MNYYTGSNTVKAMPMTYHAYLDYRNCIPEGADRAGYCVELIGDPARNHPNHEYRIVWVEASAFDANYNEHSELGFSQALYLLERGAKLTRTKWKSVEVYLTKHEPNVYITEPCLFLTVGNDTTPWFGTNEDYFAKDWQVVQEG